MIFPFTEPTPLNRLLWQAIQSKASGSLTENTVTGNPAAFATDVAKALTGLTIPFTPIQSGSGDPSPSNVRAISGFTGANIVRCGVNLWDEEWEVGTIDDNGQNKASDYNIRSKNYIPVVPGMVYYLYYQVAEMGSNIRVYYYDRNKTFISNAWTGKGTRTVPANAYYVRFFGDSKFNGTYSNNISFNYPSTDTEYHAYSGNSYAVTFPSGQTVYGGTLDAVTGVLTVEWARADMGDATWTISSNGDNHWFYSSNFLTGIKKINSSGIVAQILCDRLKTVAASTIYNGSAADNSIGQQDGATSEKLRVKATSYNDDTDAFKTAMTGVYVYYTLATPLTFQLDPVTIQTLIGNNTVWTDTNGTNTVKYLSKG